MLLAEAIFALSASHISRVWIVWCDVRLTVLFIFVCLFGVTDTELFKLENASFNLFPLTPEEDQHQPCLPCPLI